MSATPDPVAVQAFLAANRPVGCARLVRPVFDGHNQHLAATDASAIIGFAEETANDDGFDIDCLATDPAVREQLVAQLIAGLPTDAAVTWWGHESESDATFAAQLAMPAPYRRLLNMRRPLPLEPTHLAAADDTHVRPFVVGRDEDAWLRVNNAAFGWHPEQGNWTAAMFESRVSKSWFDPSGLLLHERDGRLAAFCWTKVHPASVGEIYVIAVHPDFHGHGLGRALTVTGLRHLAETGSTTAMLYVEADNTSAVRLYESLGFHIAHTDVAYHRPGSGITAGDTR